MEGQGKRILLAVAIAFGLMLVWNVVFPPPKKEDKKKTDEVEQVASSDGAQSSTGVDPDSSSPATSNGGDVAETLTPIERGEEKRIAFDFDKVRAEFSTHGAALVSWELKKRQFYDDDKTPLNFVPTHRNPKLRSFVVDFVDGATGLDPSTHTIRDARFAEWNITDQGKRHVEFTLRKDYAPGLTISKRFDVDGDNLLVTMTTKIENATSETIDQAFAVDIFGFQDPSASSSTRFGMIPRLWKAACNTDGTMRVRSAKGMQQKGPGETMGNILWGGINHSYFLIGAAPKVKSGASTVCQTFAEEPAGAMRTRIIYPNSTMKPGAPIERVLVAYLGPKYLSDLESIDAALKDRSRLGRSPSFSSSVDFGMLGFIARPLLWLLVKFYGLVGNWGLAIIFLTVFVKLLTLYWHTKSMRSMRAMGKLKPQIEELQKKHKGDRQRLQQETMALYKSHGVNPLAGCLPMILQMPIWFALYRMLMRAAELYQAEFAWIDDLTTTDPLYILPVAVMIAMFVQSRLSPTHPDSTQQKVMMYGLPLIFGAFSFVLPAGLVLYMLTNTVLTACHSLWMYRTEDAHEAKKNGGGATESADQKRTTGRKKGN